MKPRALLSNLAEADLRLLRIFIAIAESGGLAAAELRLNISRSVISRHLKDLETRLGVRLCERGRSGFALTEEGGTVLDAARRLLAQIEGFRREVAGLHGGMRGELNLAVFDKFVTNPACRLAETIAQFGAEAPAVVLNVHVASTSAIEKGLLDGYFQVGIHPHHRASESLLNWPLFSESMSLYAAPTHALLRDGAMPDDAALRGAAFVGLGYHSPNMEHFWRLGLEPAARAHDQEASVLLIRSGRYVGFLPDHYAGVFEAAGELRRIESDTLRYQCDWVASVARTPTPGRIARHFLNRLREQHGGEGHG
ncbi:LysR family transcriptional regulator [Pseudothauera nasutitermitis]|uniref:LysR family transcriptional regulator n=1 Tax=Pseudothauera nasutitermitis TaxID=2565930 RepID=A0A4S4B237_9RHOO|nr:LysR family transcriptional regulator [Pseudothauera nasutitermitis]THF66606.1 LysR family transcriptional regulator [Pseudothauera nasutitermitis]